jgi:hypothetical protein
MHIQRLNGVIYIFIIYIIHKYQYFIYYNNITYIYFVYNIHILIINVSCNLVPSTTTSCQLILLSSTRSNNYATIYLFIILSKLINTKIGLTFKSFLTRINIRRRLILRNWMQYKNQTSTTSEW